MHLNKVHLEDCFFEKAVDREGYLGIYGQICDFFLKHMILLGVKGDFFVSYSTDSYEIDVEFPSHVLKFGFIRTKANTYVLDASNFKNEVYVGTKMSF